MGNGSLKIVKTHITANTFVQILKFYECVRT